MKNHSGMTSSIVTEHLDEFITLSASEADSSRVTLTGWLSPSPERNLLARDLAASDFYSH